MSPAEVVESIRDFFRVVFADLASLWYWPLIFIGALIAFVIYMLFAIRFSYENRILKSINRLNNYFVYKPFISEENLVEFNQKMKKVPAVLRGAWQRYMLNREDGVKEYINSTTCIDKPLRTSSIEKNIKAYTVFTILFTCIAFFTGLAFCATDPNYSQAIMPTSLFVALIVPVIMLVLYSIFILVFNASKDDIYAVMYENFPLFQYNLEKAVTKMPSYVDYEILFTSREIKEGIPILQQYLEKRALIEQEQLEKARRDSVASEEYDFSDLGVDGSFVLEKAMKECEAFLRVKRMLQEESNSIESEKENYRKTFENNSKEMQRKLQASRENMDSLKKQQEESTNRIETNYIRKQLADEIKKQQQLEKDLEEATSKYNDEQISLQKEMDNRKAEIEEKRTFVEQALMLTFKHYANTLYKALVDKATEVSNERLVTLTQENNDLRSLLNDLEGGLDDGYYDDNVNLVQPQDVSVGVPYPMTEDETLASETLGIENGQPEGESEQTPQEENLPQQEYQSQEEYPQQEEYYQQEEYPQQQEYVTEEQTPAYDTADGETTTEPYTPSQEIDNVERATQEGGESDEDNEAEGDTLPPIVESVEEPVSQELTADEELEIIQKQIEEENDKLKKEKEELTSKLTTTIDKFKEKEQKRKRKASKAKSSAKSKSKSSTKSKTTSQKKSRERNQDSMSELDSLNKEMEKLLGKTK